MRPTEEFRGWLGTTLTLAGYARTGLSYADLRGVLLGSDSFGLVFLRAGQSGLSCRADLVADRTVERGVLSVLGSSLDSVDDKQVAVVQLLQGCLSLNSFCDPFLIRLHDALGDFHSRDYRAAKLFQRHSAKETLRGHFLP